MKTKNLFWVIFAILITVLLLVNFGVPQKKAMKLPAPASLPPIVSAK